MKFREKIRQLFSITQWITSYGKEQVRGDIAAGISTGLMFIPQAMAYAVIAGLPPIYGLYAGVIPLILFPLFSSSVHLSLGPVAIDMLIISSGLAILAVPESSEYIGLVLVLTFMTGVFQLIMGSLNLGSILNFFSRPIIAGFTLAAPIIIASSQLSNLFGIELSRSQDILVIFGELIENIGDTHYPTLIWGLIAILILFLLKKAFKAFPAGAVILFGSIIVAYFYQAGQKGIEIVGDIPGGLPAFSIPELSFQNIEEVLPTAIILTLIEFMTVASLGRTFARRNNYIFNTNKELTALGVANFIGSFFQAIPVSGSFSRTAIAEQADGKTPLVNFYTAIIVVATLIFLTPIFYYMPMPALAAIIIVSVLNLINIREFIALFKIQSYEGYIAVLTALCTLIIGIQEGILTGVLASLLYTLYTYTRPHVAELGLIPGTRLFQDIKRNDHALRIKKVLIIRIDASFSYMNADYFRDIILEKSKNRERETKYVILDGSTINRLDTTAIEQMEIMIETLRNWGMDLYIVGLRGHIRDIVVSSGLIVKLGPNHLFREPHEAVQFLLKKMDIHRLENYEQKINEDEE